MTRRTVAVLCGLLPGLTANSNAQLPYRINQFQSPSPSKSTLPLPLPPADENIPLMVGAGILAGAVGMVVGGYSGALITDTDDVDDDLDFLPGLVYGAAIGEGLLLPVGVHLANKRRGSLVPSVMVSTALAVAGMALALNLEDQGGAVVLVLTPVAQLISTIAIERRGSH